MSKRAFRFLPLLLVLLVAIILHCFGLYDAIYGFFNLSPKIGDDYVVFLNVGQADCTLVHSGGEYVLIDTGAYSDDAVKIKRKLLSYGVERLKAVILSHDHTDHAGGLFGILSEYEVGGIICPNGALRGDDDFTADILSSLGNTEIFSVSVGDELNFGNADIDFLWLDERTNENDSCLVLMLTLGGKRFFFGGDISASVEKRMLSAGVDVECEVYKASHHGSASSSSDMFLDVASPQYSVVMCGKNNSYGFPSEDFLQRIEQRNIVLYTTAQNGDILFNLTENTVTAKK